MGPSIALIGIDFRPETAEKIAPPYMARLDVDNCIFFESMGFKDLKYDIPVYQM